MEYIPAYLQVQISIKFNKLYKTYKKGLLIKVNPLNHVAYIGPYQIQLKKGEYALIQ